MRDETLAWFVKFSRRCRPTNFARPSFSRERSVYMNKVCALVGFGAGNGLAIAKAFGADGHKLGLISRSRSKQEKPLQELAANGFDAQMFEADAADPNSLGKAFAAIRDQVGDPSVLVYNAFAMRMATPSKTTPENLVADFRINVAGAVTAVREVLPAMRAAKDGTIIFTGGGFAIDPVPQFASIGVGKAALRNLAFSLAKELKADGIRVGTVTIYGMVRAGTHFDPKKIAEVFLALYRQPADNFQSEIEYR